AVRVPTGARCPAAIPTEGDEAGIWVGEVLALHGFRLEVHEQAGACRFTDDRQRMAVRTARGPSRNEGQRDLPWRTQAKLVDGVFPFLHRPALKSGEATGE